MKKLIAITISLFLAASVFAQKSSSFSTATYQSIKDEPSYLMNVMDWNKLSFDKYYLFSSINSATRLNITGATKVNSNTLMLSYEGNLWEDNAWGRIGTLYGFDNKAILVSYDFFEDGTYSIFGSTVSGKIYEPRVSFGINLDDKNTLKIDGSYAYVDGTNIDDSYFSATVSFRHYLQQTSKVSSALLVSYNGGFLTQTNESLSTTNKANSNYISTRFEYENQFASKAKVGLTTRLDVGYYTNELTGGNLKQIFFNPYAYAGLSCALADSVDLLLGMDIDIPKYNINIDAENTKTSFYSYYRIGLSVKPSDVVTIDGYAYLYPTSGISVENLLSSSFYLSVALKF